jgi:predicted NACHT family NTPase
MLLPYGIGMTAMLALLLWVASLLLKNSMLQWAEDGDRRRVPVMVDLHRCNAEASDMKTLVAAELARAGLGRGVAAFVERGLEDGRLRLLFDGLDEVARSEHDRVVRELRDLARMYPRCQLVVTCRGAAYFGQLAPEFTHVVRVAEFDDAAIRRFLRNWPGIETQAKVDQVFGALRKSPPLMLLARSPLVLTMIAYLQTTKFARTGSTLPNSRPAFYQAAIGHLLGRDIEMGRAGGISVYEPGDKLAVLQRVALAMQETQSAVGDRLSISRTRL